MTGVKLDFAKSTPGPVRQKTSPRLGEVFAECAEDGQASSGVLDSSGTFAAGFGDVSEDRQGDGETHDHKSTSAAKAIKYHW